MPRFLRLTDVAEVLNISMSQTYALVKRRELLAIQVGGRGQWRVEDVELEAYIKRQYDAAAAGVTAVEEDLEDETSDDLSR